MGKILRALGAIIVLILGSTSQAKTSATSSARIFEDAEWKLPTNPYQVFEGSLGASRILPLTSGLNKPDVLQLFMKRSLGRRFIVAEVKKDLTSLVQLSFVDPLQRPAGIQHRLTRVARTRKLELIIEFSRLQTQGVELSEQMVCIDGPEWYFAMRRNGLVTTGRVETCGVSGFEALGCELITGQACLSTYNLWIGDVRSR